jgi:hypothetical protein
MSESLQDSTMPKDGFELLPLGGGEALRTLRNHNGRKFNHCGLEDTELLVRLQQGTQFLTL